MTFKHFAVLLGLMALFAFDRRNYVTAYTAPGNVSCASNETDCAPGCCPYAEAVCCSDGCCHHGQICLPFGICLGLETKTGKDPVLVSSKATPIRNMNVPCPNGTTTCDFGRCCLFPNATCCEDRLHCCPSGYRCDIPNKQCVKNSEYDLNLYEQESASVKILIPKATDDERICPGDSRKCPSYSRCCISARGNWSCCPNLSSVMFNKGNGECCSTVYGYVCCPDQAPHCTVWGCRL